MSDGPPHQSWSPAFLELGRGRQSTFGLHILTDPPTNHDSLATSPPKQSDLPKPADTESPGDKEATAKSPTSDDYPRPEGGEHPQSPTKDNEKDKDNSEKEKNNKKDDQQHGNKKKDKPAFEHVKQQTMNKNPHVQANFNIKQPAGKTL